MNTDKYNRAAYKLTVWKEAARLLRETYFPEAGVTPDLVCEQVFRAPREVPTEIIQEVLVALHKAERTEELAMMKFRLEERSDDEIKSLTEDPPAREEGGSKATTSTAIAKRKAGRKASR